MKNTFLKTFGTALLTILMMATLLQNSVSAQDIDKQNQSETQKVEGLLPPRGENPRALEGTWEVQVTVRNCQTGAPIVTFASLTTFMSSGIVLDSTSGIPQAFKTPGQGVWESLGGRNYRFKFKSFSFDASGNFTGWTIITHEADLNTSDTAYTSAGIAEVYNTTGNLVSTRCTTTDAARFE
jgi:hypothetical protein